LYLVTWIGGWHAHAEHVKADAREAYDHYQKANAIVAAEARLTGQPANRYDLYPGGPQAQVHWAAPVLPGVLLARSSMAVGPGRGREEAGLVLYYGVGTHNLLMKYSMP
jgi:hypothetical protein